VTRPAVPAPPLQLWGGLEGSVVRVGDTWRDQVRETGHHGRPGDLDRIAALGIRTLRYPVLRERCTPGPVFCGWERHDARLGRMRDGANAARRGRRDDRLHDAARKVSDHGRHYASHP